MHILITGGAGFIGSTLIRELLKDSKCCVLNLDKLTYGSNLGSLEAFSKYPNHKFIRGDVVDQANLKSIIHNFCPDAVIHLAAESHVDRSIINTSSCINTNILGTYSLLEAVRAYWDKLNIDRKESFRFYHISTDEVYGNTLDLSNPCTEKKQYLPSSPYSASKAASNHLVQAWSTTYGLPTLVSNCSNNYGPFQSLDKFIPKVIVNSLTGTNIPVYGDGLQTREWLFVEDHVHAILSILRRGKIGEVYNIGSGCRRKNIDVIQLIFRIISKVKKFSSKEEVGLKKLITFIQDRSGHDRSYAIDSNKIREDLGWYPREKFDDALHVTVKWYMDSSKLF